MVDKAKRKLCLFRTYTSFLFYDSLTWFVGVDSWKRLRSQSKEIYDIIKLVIEKHGINN